MTVHHLEQPIPPTLANSLVRMTTDQYHMMIERGIIPVDHSTELLDGLIVRKDRAASGEDLMSHSPAHRLVVSLLGQLASRLNTDSCHLAIQLPICIEPFDEPEPDASIIRGQPRDYADRIPGPADVSSVIEVADSSLERDAREKLPKYAAAGIPQYLIINLRDAVIENYTRPDPASRTYLSRTVAHKGQSLLLHFPATHSLEILAQDLLP